MAIPRNYVCSFRGVFSYRRRLVPAVSHNHSCLGVRDVYGLQGHEDGEPPHHLVGWAEAVREANKRLRERYGGGPLDQSHCVYHAAVDRLKHGREYHWWRFHFALHFRLRG